MLPATKRRDAPARLNSPMAAAAAADVQGAVVEKGIEVHGPNGRQTAADY